MQAKAWESFWFEKPQFHCSEINAKVSAGIKKCHGHKFEK